jgi:hypothetical protein
MRCSALDVYRMYIAMKTHFNDDRYDYVASEGKVKAFTKSLEKRSDKAFFYRIGELYQRETIFHMLLSTFAHEPHTWIGELNESRVMEHYHAWVRYTQNLEDSFKEELEIYAGELHRLGLTWQQGIEQHQIVDMLIRGEVTLEFAAIVDSVVGFSENPGNNPLMAVYMKKIRKYSRFLSELISRSKVASTIESLFGPNLIDTRRYLDEYFT